MSAQRKLDSLITIAETDLNNRTLGLLPITANGAFAWHAPLPDAVYRMYNLAMAPIRYLANSWPEHAPEAGKGPPKPQELAAEGGAMEYRSPWMARNFAQRTGEKAYNWLKKRAESEGYDVREKSYDYLLKQYGRPLQGHEDGYNLDVMNCDKDGSNVSFWKMARILAHEYYGAKCFTRKGRSHEANHGKIGSMADNLLSQLAAA